ncbi:phage tail protein [Magnetococcales bacterium HHB-1]
MSDAILGEIRMIAFNYAPKDWAMCDGQMLQIADHQALFSLIGTTFGGDGRNTFALPDLRGRAPVHQGEEIRWGQMGGVENVVLTQNQLPSHTHNLLAQQDGTPEESPENNFLLGLTETEGQQPEFNMFKEGATNIVQLREDIVSEEGKNQSHNNMQPYLVINYIVSLEGDYPTPD